MEKVEKIGCLNVTKTHNGIPLPLLSTVQINIFVFSHIQKQQKEQMPRFFVEPNDPSILWDRFMGAFRTHSASHFVTNNIHENSQF